MLRAVRQLSKLIVSTNQHITSISALPTSPQMRQREHINSKFDTSYTDSKKSETTNISAKEVRDLLNKNYQNHIYDGSILDSLDSGDGFVIPDLKVQFLFYFGKGFSIFTSEVHAIFKTKQLKHHDLRHRIHEFFWFFVIFPSITWHHASSVSGRILN